MASRQAFRGPRRKLVLAFDIGTTYSGISYSVLDPGVVPEIKGVKKFPAHEHVTGSSKIPTVIYYDRDGEIKAVGAEAMIEGMYEEAEDKKWAKAEWFKLHLRPKIALEGGRQFNDDIPPLPPGKTVVDIFADFLGYLYQCAAAYIKDTHTNGVALWGSVNGETDFVLSHPNGWEGTQGEMRKAAVQAGLVPDTLSGHARLFFVTEGEASLHYAIHNGIPDAATRAGDGVVIVDAGGGTIVVSSYKSTSKDAFEEVAVPQCHFNGSVFVSINAQDFLSNFLEDSSYLDDRDHIVRCFDKTTKLRFRDAKEAQYIKFGLISDNDPVYNIRYGQLKLEGSDVALFFKKSIKCIVQAVISQRNTALKSISHVVLVGGFSASDWVYSQVTDALTPLGFHVTRPGNHVNKAVSDGAISFYLTDERSLFSSDNDLASFSLHIDTSNFVQMIGVFSVWSARMLKRFGELRAEVTQLRRELGDKSSQHKAVILDRDEERRRRLELETELAVAKKKLAKVSDIVLGIRSTQ